MPKFKSLLSTGLLLFATGASACAQEKPKRMVPGSSVKELVPELPNEKEDGISRIIIGQLFKPGNTDYIRTGSAGLENAPPLPTGHVLFKNLLFEVHTEAVSSGYQLTVFNVPSADNEPDFNRLTILHLEDDEMSPAGKSWQPVTVIANGWDDYYQFVSKTEYESLEPDFRLRRLAAVTHKFGTFAIAKGPDPQVAAAEPFAKFEVITSTSPEPVGAGENVTHKIVLTNKGPGAAAEVDLKAELDADFDYRPTATQGSCKRSDESSGRMLCYLGVMAPGSTATLTFTGTVSQHQLLSRDVNEFGNTLEVVFKKNPTDLVDTDTQLITRFSFKVSRKP